MFGQLAQPNPQGPAAWFAELLRTKGVHRDFARELQLSGGQQIDVGNFMHRHREAWRRDQWSRLARSKPDEFGGIERGINRVYTLCLYKWIRKEANTTQEILDAQHDHQLGFTDDARYRLAVLRAILHGGCWTAERRATRYADPTPGAKQCMCGAALETVWHVSWACPLYRRERQPAIDFVNTLPGAQPKVQRLPACFQNALLVNDQVTAHLDLDAIWNVQESILAVWLARAKRLGYGPSAPPPLAPTPPTTDKPPPSAA